MQTITKLAALKDTGNYYERLALLKVEPKVYRWVVERTGDPFNGIDYVDESMAIAALRVLVESDPGYVGYDLTILPVEPPAEQRAAERIAGHITRDWDMDIPGFTEDFAQIISEETNVTGLTHATNDLLAYYLRVAFQPKPAGLDMTMAGLVLTVIEALEVTMKQDFTNIKKRLTDGVNQIQVFGSLPPGMKQ